MSLFGNVGKGLKGLFGNGGGGAGLADGMAQAQAYLAGDYGAAANIAQNGQLRRLKIEQERKAQQDEAQLEATIDSDPRLNTPELKAYAKANPKAYIENLMQMFQPRQFGPGGGSLGLPDSTGHLSFQTAPRFDDNGTIYGPGNGTSAPPILQRGTKTVPLQPGGSTDVRDAISGAQVMSDGSVPQIGVPPRAPMLSAPPDHVVAFLRQHPETADQFDQRYGMGAAAKILSNGGASPSNGLPTFP
jgi:hypothetical protein